MKKIAKFMFIAVVAAFAVVSCGKNASPTPDPTPDPQPEPEPEPAVEVKLAIDGKFDEWKDVAEVPGAGAIICSKTQSDDQKIYFYLEVAADEMNTENVPFANYLSLYLDCGEELTPTDHWGDEEDPATYDILLQIWLMTNGSATMANWDAGFVGKAKISDGLYKAEFSLARSSNELLQSKMIKYGMFLTDQTVEKDASGEEVWMPGEDIGSSPYADEGDDMAKVNV